MEVFLLETLKFILKTLQEWIGLLTPFSIAIGALWKFWLKKRYEEGRELYKKVQIIAEEFRPNGGSTLRDAINRIEQTVTVNEQKTLALIKSLPLGTWISDSKGKCIDVNKSLCKITGRTESELKGDNWSNWIHLDMKDDVFDEWYRCVQNDLNFDMEYIFVKPDGKLQKVHGFAYQLKDKDGKLIGFLGTLSALD